MIFSLPLIQDEKMSSALVKQRFAQRSLPLPQEDVEGSVKPFYCSLKNITYNVKYDGQGLYEHLKKKRVYTQQNQV